MKQFIFLAATGLSLVACSSTKDVCDTQNVSVEQGIPAGTPAEFQKHGKDRVYFNFNKHTIEPEAEPRLDTQAGWLKTYSATRATLEGNCDARGTVDYNRALGERRSQAVKNALVARGVSADRLSTVSFGKDKIAPGNDPKTHAENRNVTTVISG